jgi:hypothetical protein
MAKKPSLPIANMSTTSYKPSEEDKERSRRYRAEDALRDIERAEGHKADKDLMKDVKKLAGEKVKNLNKVCGK